MIKIIKGYYEKVLKEDEFVGIAYDGCHKIYLLEDLEDEKQARQFDYDIYPLYAISHLYNISCGLRFIRTWKGSKTYVEQFDSCKIEVVGV